MYIVTLTTDSTPFADDARYDKVSTTLFSKSFEEKRQAKKFFNSYAKENKMLMFRNEASGDGKILSWTSGQD